MSLIYNPDTKQLIQRLNDNFPHALLLTGVPGVGLNSIAKTIAWRDLAGIVQPTDADSNVTTSAKGIIRIPQIRELILQTRGKLTKRQVFIIDDADKMNSQAQNAFLKLLEEPAEHIHFILTSHNPHLLLPTVLSRVQRVIVRPVAVEDSKRLIAKLGVTEPRKIQQLMFLASGRPAEINRLVADEKMFNERAELMSDARTFIQGKPYERTIVAARYYSDRAKTLELLELARSIITYSMVGSPTRELVQAADLLATTYDRIAANGNTRLQLMNFVIQ